MHQPTCQQTNQNIDRSRRKGCLLKQTDLMNILVGKLRITNFPEDFEVVSVHWDHWANSFYLAVVSNEFDEVGEGEKSPEMILDCELL